MNPLQFCVPVVHKKSHATYVIVYVLMNPLQFCVPVVHKNLMRLYTCPSCHNRFLSTSVLFHSATCSSHSSDSLLKKNYKSDSLVMKPVGPYRNIKHVALFSQADTKLIFQSSNHFQLSGSLLQISSISLKLS